MVFGDALDTLQNLAKVCPPADTVPGLLTRAYRTAILSSYPDGTATLLLTFAMLPGHESSLQRFGIAMRLSDADLDRVQGANSPRPNTEHS